MLMVIILSFLVAIQGIMQLHYHPWLSVFSFFVFVAGILRALDIYFLLRGMATKGWHLTATDWRWEGYQVLSRDLKYLPMRDEFYATSSVKRRNI